MPIVPRTNRVGSFVSVAVCRLNGSCLLIAPSDGEPSCECYSDVRRVATELGFDGASGWTRYSANRRRRSPAIWVQAARMAVSTLSTKLADRARSSWHSNSSSDCVMRKTGHPNWLSGLRNYTADEGRPLEPACRSRLKPPSAAAPLRGVVVSGEGKGPEAKFGSGDF
jgi:hypothetical protein